MPENRANAPDSWPAGPRRQTAVRALMMRNRFGVLG